MSNLVKNMSAFDSFIRLKYKEGVWWNNGKPTHPLYADLWDAWQARVPEGYKLVPVELADEIEDKIWDNLSSNHTITNQEGDGFIPVEDIDLGGIYKAMIEAVEK